MAILHIDRSTEKEENFQDIDSPTADQIREAIQNCGVEEFTFISITGNWRFNGHMIKCRLGFTRGIKNRFKVSHSLPSVNNYLHLYRLAIDPMFAESYAKIPIVLDNGEGSLYLIKHTVDIEVAIAIATQFAEYGTLLNTVEWTTPPQFTAYLQSLDAK